MKIYMMGDSIMKFNNINRYPQTGWGQMLPLFLKDCLTVIENHAENGRSTKSFYDEGRFDVILNKLEEGDYVICSFGHNDEKIIDPLRYTTLEEYKSNLKRYADLTRSKGASIIFATPVTRHDFKDGILSDTHKGYPNAMLEFANEYNYPCVDLNQATIDLCNKIGSAESLKFYMVFPPNTYKNYIEGKDDRSHLLPYGARTVAELFVKGLSHIDCSLNDYFLKLDELEEIDWAMLKD